MKSAPVIIPTLNRIEHLKRCIESLESCLGASETEVYVSVDFPPSEKYKEGYMLVIDYLEAKSKQNNFLSLYVYIQKENLGPSNNLQFLRNKIKEDNYENVIVAEDDNEFAISFLKFINEGLQQTRARSNIISVNGYKDIDWIYHQENTVFACKLFPAYGYGIWIDHYEKMRKDVEQVLLSPKTMGIKSVSTLFKKNKYLFALYVNGIISSDSGIFWNESKKLRIIDSAIAIYMHLTDKICIVPAISKVRNWGNDGSGVNMPKRDKYTEKDIVLDTDFNFKFCCNDFCYNPKNYILGNDYLLKTQGSKLVYIAIAEYILFVIFGKKRDRILKVRKLMERNYEPN